VSVAVQDLVLLFPVIFIAIFTQSLTGFGSALVAMVLLPPLLGLQVAAPLVALVAPTTEAGLLLRYRRAVNFQPVWRLCVGAVVAIPLGVVALRRIDEKITLTILGIVVVGYALYALSNFKLPRLEQPGWAFVFGFAAGLLGGAYNTAGPPTVVYGDSRRWSPTEFKANLQSFFLVNDLLVVLSHAVSGNLTPVVWQGYLLGLPAIGLGMWAGLYCDRFLNPAAFRTVVLCLLIGLGLRMLF
jgi:uncharacterized membrane protein YfcA